jgi:hypothetical protein
MRLEALGLRRHYDAVSFRPARTIPQPLSGDSQVPREDDGISVLHLLQCLLRHLEFEV